MTCNSQHLLYRRGKSKPIRHCEERSDVAICIIGTVLHYEKDNVGSGPYGGRDGVSDGTESGSDSDFMMSIV